MPLFRSLPRRRPPVPLTLYTRAGCHLCELMRAELERDLAGRAWTLEEVDIDADPELEQRYGRSIPVLHIGGRLAFKGRIGPGELKPKFARLAREWDREEERA